MTDTELDDLFARTCAGISPLSPAAEDRLLGDALATGRVRRRRRRRVVATAWTTGTVALAVAGAVAVAAVLGTGSQGPSRGEQVAVDPRTSISPSAPSAPATATSYAPGDGPIIPTERRIVGDRALTDVTRTLVPRGTTLTDVRVEHVATRVISHESDRLRAGRMVSFRLDGAAASVTVQRWDGNAAVGVADPTATSKADLGQRLALTAQEACGGAYRTGRQVACTRADGGYYGVSRPSQGAAMPSSYRELLLAYFTDDGYVVLVDSYNTGGEKAGGIVSPEPVLDVAQSLRIATDPRWFAG